MSATTYSTLVGKAEEISLDEFWTLVEESHGAATIYGKGKPRRHATDIRLCTPGYDSIFYTYCGLRTGYTKGGFCLPYTVTGVVFDFYSLGRIVKVARPARP